MIYLDSAATTQIEPEVLDEMINYLKNHYGNPSSKYYPEAIHAQNALSNSRKSVANLLGTLPEFVVFTSGASESNNFIIKGIAEKYSSKGRHIITSKIEHKSILETCKHLEKNGYEITYLTVDSDGFVDINELTTSIRKDTILVSVMWVNNEIGTINDIETISSICRSKNVLFHTDATQAVGKLEIDLSKLPVDFLSFSAHKIYGPKGIGAAYIGPDELGLRYKLPSLIHGGSQEFKMRAGTHAMHDIVGFGKACEVALRDMDDYVMSLVNFENKFTKILKMRIPEIKFLGSQQKKVPGLLSISIPGINNELFCKQISSNYSISTGSACTINEGSYVIDSISHTESDYFRISIDKYIVKTISISDLVNIITNIANRI